MINLVYCPADPDDAIEVEDVPLVDWPTFRARLADLGPQS